MSGGNTDHCHQCASATPFPKMLARIRTSTMVIIGLGWWLISFTKILQTFCTRNHHSLWASSAWTYGSAILANGRVMSSPKVLEITPQCQRPIYRGVTKRKSACLPGSPTRQLINFYKDTHCFTQTTKKECIYIMVIDKSVYHVILCSYLLLNTIPHLAWNSAKQH